MDGRYASLRVIPETVALDTANDVLALSADSRQELEKAYQAHVMDDWPRFLHHVARCDDALRHIRDAARRWADDVTAAPEIHPDQLPLLAA